MLGLRLEFPVGLLQVFDLGHECVDASLKSTLFFLSFHHAGRYLLFELSHLLLGLNLVSPQGQVKKDDTLRDSVTHLSLASCVTGAKHLNRLLLGRDVAFDCFNMTLQVSKLLLL